MATENTIDKDEGKPLVLVGTYRAGQLEAWPGYYNYPISDADEFDSGVLASVRELWLFNSVRDQMTLSAEFIGVKTRGELVADYGYSARGKAHAEKYLLFKTSPAYAPMDDAKAKIIVRVRDFAHRSPAVAKKLKAYLESSERTDAVLAGKLPKILVDQPPERLCVCENALQLDFFSFVGFDSMSGHLRVARKLIDEAHENRQLTCIEICAGAGGQAIGLDRAGFVHVALVEFESEYCDVLKSNKPEWNVICGDVRKFDGTPYQGIDLLAGGVPCPPFSVASKQLGKNDERDLFPEAIRLISEIRPRAVMLENVRGLLDPKFNDYRESILKSISDLGYATQIKLLHASDYGVPQIRPRVIIVGIRLDVQAAFTYPEGNAAATPSVGRALEQLMGANGWRGLQDWVDIASKVAPTIVGGSKKHGGPDLGPTRARKQWAELGVDGLGIANEAPAPDFVGMPRLTKEMIARIQGFPGEWNFGRKKTSACRMIGNAFPPPVAEAVGVQIRKCLENEA